MSPDPRPPSPCRIISYRELEALDRRARSGFWWGAIVGAILGLAIAAIACYVAQWWPL